MVCNKSLPCCISLETVKAFPLGRKKRVFSLLYSVNLFLKNFWFTFRSKMAFYVSSWGTWEQWQTFWFVSQGISNDTNNDLIILHIHYNGQIVFIQEHNYDLIIISTQLLCQPKEDLWNKPRTSTDQRAA